MAVEAVVAVVMQKLKDMLKEESVAHSKVILHQLKEIQSSLRKMQHSSINNTVAAAQDNSEIGSERWATKYLHILYNVEDEIEKFTFQIARQQKRLGFLMKQTLFFNNLNASRKLCRKMKKIQIQIDKINQARVEVSTSYSTTTLSVQSCFAEEEQSLLNSLPSISDTSDADPIEEEDEEMVSKSLQRESPNSGTLIRSLSASPRDRERVLSRKKLTFSYSYNEEEMGIVGIKEERLRHPKQMSSFSYQEEELGIFGLKEDVDTLVHRLTKKGERVVLIVGEVGSGKTTLARAIYRNRDIKHHFEFRAWVSVLKGYTAGDILLSLSKSMDIFKEKGAMNPDQQVLKTRIFDHLKEKRYILLLDGVGSCRVWEDLKDAFPDEKNGSKIIFTDEKNGSKIIFTSGGAGKSPETTLLPHCLKRLSEEDSWNMFLKKAGKEKARFQIPEYLKQRVLEICNGLPLNIVLIAGLLSTKKTSNWSAALSFGQTSDDIVSLCYNDLTLHSKLCLLYLVLFPKEYDIPVRRLLRLWLAEGFVTRRSAKIFPEDLVQKYFEDLVDRSMIEISKLRSDNSPRRCRLLGVLHDYLLPKAQDISLFYIHRSLEYHEDEVGPFGVRRMVEYVDTEGVFAKRGKEHTQVKRAEGSERSEILPTLLRSLSSFFPCGKQKKNRKIGNSSPHSLLSDPHQTRFKGFALNPSLLRSYLSFNVRKKDVPAKEVGIFLSRIIDSGFGLLRVLDLEGVYQPSLPEKLGDLHHLRYLGLRWTFLDSLPQSVGDLPYLETLDVKHTNINSLPDSIWKLKHLRHLNLNDIRLAMPPRSSLTLQTLWGLFVDENILVKDGLGKLLGLRELGISFHLSASQDDLLDWIAKLTALQSLRLRSKDDMGHPSKLVLKPLPNLGQLSHLNLLGSLETLLDPCEFPPTLKVLTLSISQLKKDPMQTLGQLPCLTVLRLLGNSYIGKQMVCTRGGFSKLRVLKLWKLEELEEWDVEDGAMQSLKELNIRSCHKLKNIPPRLLQPRCLEELILTDMRQKFIAHVEGRKSKDISLTISPWESNPLPREEGVSSVLQPVAVEGKGGLVKKAVTSE